MCLVRGEAELIRAFLCLRDAQSVEFLIGIKSCAPVEFFSMLVIINIIQLVHSLCYSLVSMFPNVGAYEADLIMNLL